MHPRGVLNFVYVHLKPRDASEEDREKFDDALYAPLDGGRRGPSLIEQLGG